MCGLDWLFTRLNNWLWFSGFYGGLFFSSFISSGDAAFIHAWALPAILLYEIHRNERNNDNPLKFSDEIVVSN